MGFPKHYLLSFGGPLGHDETWSCSLRMTSPVVEVMPDPIITAGASSSIDEVARKVETYMTTQMAQYWHKSAKLGFVKYNAIGENGRYIGDTTVEKLYEPAMASTSQSNGPFQMAIVVSLETGVQRGLAVAGRWFLPFPGFSVSDDGYLLPASQNWVADASALFVNSLNDWDGIDVPGAPRVCVISRGRPTGPKTWGPGIARRATNVAVGNVLDTQRRRRKALKETYTIRPVP
jgi:hypothetical protein